MNLTVFPTPELGGVVIAPPSKSYTHRAMVISSLAKGKSVVKSPLASGDTLSTIKACVAFGADIKQKKSWFITGTGGKLNTPDNVIDVENSGTTIRFMTAVAALAPGATILTGDQSIRRRPMDPLLQALRQLGVEAFSTQDNTPPVVIRGGGLKGGKVKIRGDISSQFISGLLIVSPYSRKNVTIEILGKLRSAPYIEMTLELLSIAGAKLDYPKELQQFFIQGNQIYSPIEFKVPGDFSSASYMLAAAALTKSKAKVKNLPIESKQGDRQIIDILKEMGSHIKALKNEVIVEGGAPLTGTEIDASDIPDLVPTLAVLATVAKGKTIIKNVPHARYKETDRLKAPAIELKKMGAKIKELPDGLIIEGIKQLKGARVHGYFDHRMIMALAVAGLVAKGKTIIDTAEAVNISFPEFVKSMQKLGANLRID